MCVGLARHHGGLLAGPNVFGGFESIRENGAPVARSDFRTSWLASGRRHGGSYRVGRGFQNWHARDFRKPFDPRNICRVEISDK